MTSHPDGDPQMDGGANGIPLSAMVPAARFYSREEAEAMTALAAEAGITAPVVDAARSTATFDMSLGAVGSADGFTVFVDPADLDLLRATLEKNVEIDPMDPLCSLSTAELHELAGAPLNANLTEKVIAARLLSARTDGTLPPPLPSTKSTAGFRLDPHADDDARLGRWLGTLTVFSLVAYLWFTILATPWVREWINKEGLQGSWKRGAEQGSVFLHRDTFAGGIRVPLFGILPSAASFALVCSRRKLGDNSVRPMFARHWRIAGFSSFVLAMAGFIWFLTGPSIVGFFQEL